MATVYVVTAGSGDTYHIERIYLDRDQADQFAQDYNGMAPNEPELWFRSKEEVADMSFFVFLESHFGHRTSESVPKTISSNTELHLLHSYSYMGIWYVTPRGYF